MKQEPQPVASSRDQYSRSKSKIEKNKINKSACNSPSKEKQRSKGFAIQVTAIQVWLGSTKAADSVVSNRKADKRKRKIIASSSMRITKAESSSIGFRNGKKLKRMWSERWSKAKWWNNTRRRKLLKCLKERYILSDSATAIQRGKRKRAQQPSESGKRSQILLPWGIDRPLPRAILPQERISQQDSVLFSSFRYNVEADEFEAG